MDTKDHGIKPRTGAVCSGQIQPTFDHIKGSFSSPDFYKLYKVVPVKNVHQVELTWHLPSMLHLYRYVHSYILQGTG